MARTIILPREIDNRLRVLTKTDQESKGVLLYRQKEDKCIVEAIYMINIGTERKVKYDLGRNRVLIKFLQENPEYNFIQFHTHTREGIAKFGEQNAYNFSKVDIEIIKKVLKIRPEQITMLVTPETTLLSGMDNPKLDILEHSEAYEQNHGKIDATLERIADNLGVGHESLRGTMKIR